MIMGMQAKKWVGEFPNLFLEDICHIIIELLASGRYMHDKDRTFIIFRCTVQFTLYKGKIRYGDRVIVFEGIRIQADETECGSSAITM